MADGGAGAGAVAAVAPHPLMVAAAARARASRDHARRGVVGTTLLLVLRPAPRPLPAGARRSRSGNPACMKARCRPCDGPMEEGCVDPGYKTPDPESAVAAGQGDGNLGAVPDGA